MRIHSDCHRSALKFSVVVHQTYPCLQCFLGNGSQLNSFLKSKLGLLNLGQGPNLGLMPCSSLLVLSSVVLSVSVLVLSDTLVAKILPEPQVLVQDRMKPWCCCCHGTWLVDNTMDSLQLLQCQLLVMAVWLTHCMNWYWPRQWVLIYFC